MLDSFLYDSAKFSFNFKINFTVYGYFYRLSSDIAMSHSKELPGKSDAIDIKVHYVYHGAERCGLVDINFTDLYTMGYTQFTEFLKGEIPQLSRLSVMRISFLDDEKTYVDLTPRNFHRFIRLATYSFKSQVPKINVKIQEGSSPVVAKTYQQPTSSEPDSKRSLVFDSAEYASSYQYKSPVEMDIELKKREIQTKENELSMLQNKYDELWNNYNPPVCFDTSKTVCTRCHLRLGHSKNRCHMEACQSAAVCGLIDRHPAQKKELQELAKKKQRIEGELKAFTSELKVKEKVSSNIEQSFEAKIHDILIRTNPNKYLTDQRRPKEGIILADSYIIKKYYDKQNPDKAKLERDSDIFQTIIKSFEEKRNVVPKNSVIKQYEEHGIKWPTNNSEISRPAPVGQMFAYPGQYGWSTNNYCPSFPTFSMPFQQPFYTPHSGSLTPVATPPPPPPEEGIPIPPIPPLPESDDGQDGQ